MTDRSKLSQFGCFFLPWFLVYLDFFCTEEFNIFEDTKVATQLVWSDKVGSFFPPHGFFLPLRLVDFFCQKKSVNPAHIVPARRKHMVK